MFGRANWMRAAWGIAALVGLLIGSAVSQRGSDIPAQPGDAEAGRRLFLDPDWTPTGLTCNHCHANFNEKKTPDGFIRPGYSLFNSGYRTELHTWDGQVLKSLSEAIAICMSRWMAPRIKGQNEGDAPEKHHVRQLVAYLRSEDMVQEKKARPVEPMWTKTLPGDRLLKAGEANLGIRVFNRSCSPCHHDDGSGPAPSLIRNGYSRYQIAKKIRRVENPGLNGLVMPAFTRDRLSDRELINVASYVFQK